MNKQKISKRKITSIGVLTSGGDAPGMNAAIRAVVKSCYQKNINPFFIYNGFHGLVNNQICKAKKSDVGNFICIGGSKIGCARYPEFKKIEVRKLAIKNLQKHGIQALVIIGGDGSFMGGHELTKMGINCICLPGTIDNDIPIGNRTIGFDTALNTIVQNIDKIRDTSSSHHRCSIIETMGNTCGDLALYASIASGAELVSTPENKKTIPEIKAAVLNAMKAKKSHVLLVVSEKLYNINELAIEISESLNISTRATVLGHVQRGGSPSSYDRILATTMGIKAIDLLTKNYKGLCILYKENKLITVDILTLHQNKHLYNHDLYNYLE